MYCVDIFVDEECYLRTLFTRSCLYLDWYIKILLVSNIVQTLIGPLTTLQVSFFVYELFFINVQYLNCLVYLKILVFLFLSFFPSIKLFSNFLSQCFLLFVQFTFCVRKARNKSDTSYSWRFVFVVFIPCPMTFDICNILVCFTHLINTRYRLTHYDRV